MMSGHLWHTTFGAAKIIFSHSQLLLNNISGCLRHRLPSSSPWPSSSSPCGCTWLRCSPWQAADHSIRLPFFAFQSPISSWNVSPGKHGVHPAGTRGLPHGGFYGGYGAHYRGKREAEAEGDAEPREERSYGHGKAHPGPGKAGNFSLMATITSACQRNILG